jgi:hypothetical protein
MIMPSPAQAENPQEQQPQQQAAQPAPQQQAQNPLLQAVPVRIAEPAPPVQALAKTPSGESWVGKYPTQRSTDSLDAAWKPSVDNFISALEAAGAQVHISESARNEDKVYLMHYAYRIAKEGMDPSTVPARDGVDIEWVHRDAAGSVDLEASKAAAQAMVDKFNIVYKPSLTSRHIDGLAVDMSIAWTGDLSIKDADGKTVTIKSEPRTGADNAELHAVGETYGVKKLGSDAPHWSSDGK